VAPLNPDEVQSLLLQVTGWSATDSDTKIGAMFPFKNFRQALDIVAVVGELTESEFHHPAAVNFAWGFCAIVLQTKKDQGRAWERRHHGGEYQRSRCGHGRR
jgi:4a-hydroxytetrahydrobiopterin dehydratase